jgi:hypothetical protein
MALDAHAIPTRASFQGKKIVACEPHHMRPGGRGLISDIWFSKWYIDRK